MDYKQIFTTGEIIDLISKDKELRFEAVTGMYKGEIVSFNEHMSWLMWNTNNKFEPICMNDEFMSAKWRVLEPAYIVIKYYPIYEFNDSAKIFTN